MKIPAREAVAIAQKNRQMRVYPNKLDPRYQSGLIHPIITPRFTISPGCRIFTIGSCFARNIEEKLQGFELPTKTFFVPKTEWPNRPNGLLNEYNPGTMHQRISYALNGKSFAHDAIVEEGSGFADLLLPTCPPVSKKRLLERREDIDRVYRSLVSSDVVIITLGLVETWYDLWPGLFLNRMPPYEIIQNEPSRFEFRILDFEESHVLTNAIVSELVASGCSRIVLTISPVPLATTFSGHDCVVANCYSKSLLRVCAEELLRNHPEVDYFPSYEMASLKGPDAYIDDLIHVKDNVVEVITNYMVERYISKGTH